MVYSRIATVFSLALCFLSACSPQNEEATASGPFGLNPSNLVDVQRSYQMNMVGPDATQPIGVAHSIVQHGTSKGKAIINLILVQELSAGTMRDSLVVDAQTLLPIEYFNSMPGFQTIHSVYDSDGHVRSDVVRMGASSFQDTLLVGAHLDAASFTSLLPAFTYDQALDVQLPVFHYDEGVMTYGLKVIQDEQIDSCTGLHDTWVVETVSGQQATRHWVDKTTNQVVQVIVDLGEGRRFEQTLLCGD